MKYSIERLEKCLLREIGMRKRVYPDRVDARAMTQQEADDEIEMMLEIKNIVTAQEPKLL